MTAITNVQIGDKEYKPGETISSVPPGVSDWLVTNGFVSADEESRQKGKARKGKGKYDVQGSSDR